MPAFRGATKPGDERRPKNRLGENPADRRTFGRTQLLDLLIDIANQFGMLPSDHRLCGDDLYRLPILLAEAGGQIRVAFHHRVHRVTQAARVQGTCDCETQLYRVDVVLDGIPGGLSKSRLEQQALLQRGKRQHVGNFVLLHQRVDLLLSQACRHQIRRRQAASAGTHMSADPTESLEPQPTETCGLCVVQSRRRPGPIGPKFWSGLGVRICLDDPGVELH
ncbi:Uncharacterised protein [Mycobacteroides abscessus subsp. massiliense]|nr:Uncharacterised protein [Mycobacteroides abscessus subsp. massiliense]